MPIGIGEGKFTMVLLTSETLQRLQDSIRKIYSNLDSKALPAHIIQATSRVIPSGVTSFATISQKNQKLCYAGQASLREWEGLDAFVRHMDEHPILNYLHFDLLRRHRFREEIEQAMDKRFPSLRQDQHYTAAKISDALTNRRYRALGIYNEFFRRNEADYQLLISFLPSGNGYSMISFNRDKRDFSEEERLVLNFLGPHIAQAYKNAEACAKARRTFAALEGSPQSFKSYGLTYREEDVLYWVAQGKTNGETAGILNIAPGTVKIHLEKIYQKLGVESRTAASALAMGIIGNRKNVD
ncbi:MAG: helix-turn-helix transcriptional regulator [Nitrospiraceae bacterium]|nr:helix-turn-helix transcriptional regulator [Nitrospiraceae bacterium]